MTGPSPQRLQRFAFRSYELASYFRRPGDGRRRPRIPAQDLLWSLVVGQILREGSFHGVEALVRSSARTQLGVGHRFGDDALAYFTERLDPETTRQALTALLHRARRKKAFQSRPFLGLALDGTGVARCTRARCPLCHPVHNAEHQVTGYGHHFSMVSVVGAGLSLPFDVEPYAAGGSEYAASQALCQRAVQHLGRRFADYAVVDGLYAKAPFLHMVGGLGLHVVVRLKANLPELLAQAQARFTNRPPSMRIEEGADRIELWDAEDFDPWETLRWPTVRVLRYRQYKPSGKIVEAYWLTDYPLQQVGSRSLFRMAKSRWEIENQGFNEGKTYHALEHITHHHANSLLLGWLLTLLALSLERLYRMRYLHRGTHRVLAPIDLLRKLRLALALPRLRDTS
ncbi:MAG: hypothetical protein V1912_07575 [bacterium]